MWFFPVLRTLCVVSLLATQILAATKIIVPLYTDPTDIQWSSLESTLANYPTINFIIIINPNSGPDSSSPDTDWITGVTKLKSYGNVQVIGYVYTKYGSRSINDVKADVSAYAAWPIACRSSGIFFDETAENKVPYYTIVAAFTRSTISNALVVLNPGTLASFGYFNIADQVMIHEVPYSSYIGGENGVPSGVSGSRLSVIVHSMPIRNNALSTLVTNLVSAGYGSIYLTDDPATYAKFGTDWNTFCSLMNATIAGNVPSLHH